MNKFDNNEIFLEASKAKRKFKPIIVVLFFILVFDIGAAIQNIVCIPSMGKWSVELLPQMEAILSDPNASISDLLALIGNIPPYVMIPLLFGTIGTTILSIIYVTKIEKRSLASMGFFKQKFLTNYPLGYLIGAFIMVISALGCLLFKGISIKAGGFNLLIILFFLGYIVQGMSEEVLCRGFFMISLRNSMKNKYATLIAVLISSLAFALLHSINPGLTLVALLNLFLSGVFFALLTLRFDNLWVPCAAHAAWNFFQGHVLGSQVSGMDSNYSFLVSEQTGHWFFHGGSFGFEGSLMIMFILIVGIALLFVFPKKSNHEISDS